MKITAKCQWGVYQQNTSFLISNLKAFCFPTEKLGHTNDRQKPSKTDKSRQKPTTTNKKSNKY